jgi:hypothetical protein
VSTVTISFHSLQSLRHSMHEAGREGFAYMELYEVEERIESHTKELSDEYLYGLVSEGEDITTKSAVNLKTQPPPTHTHTHTQNCHGH